MYETETSSRILFWKMNSGEGTPAWMVHAAIGIADGLIYVIPLLLLWMWLGNPLDMAGALGVAAIVHAGVMPLRHRAGQPITDSVQWPYRLVLARPIAAGWIRR